MADMVNGGYCIPGDMLCPTSVCPGMEKLNDLCDASSICTTGIGSGSDGELTDPPDPIDIDETTQMIRDGYNSNYAASWYFVRTGMRPELVAKALGPCYETPPDSPISIGDGVAGHPTWAYDSSKGLNQCLGGLTSGVLNNAGVSPSRVPLLGDGNYGAFGEAILDYDIPGYMKKGQTLYDSFIGYSGDEAEPGDFEELKEMFYGDLVGLKRSGKW